MGSIFKKIGITLCLFFSLLNAYGQKENNLLKKYEIDLLQLLLADTTGNSNFVLSNSFNFGIDNQLFTNSSIVKKGGLVYIQPLGTGRVYQAINQKGQVQLNRIDRTTHSGVNFFAQNFFIKDTLFQFGGLGFWNIRGLITYFSPLTKEWELLQTNKAVPSYFNNLRDVVIHYQDADNAPKLYLSNSYYYPNYPSSFESEATDSCYEFSFNTRTWKTLGKLNPEFKKVSEIKHARTIEIHLGDLTLFESQLEFYWANFKTNQSGIVSPKQSDRLRQAWLAFYNNDGKKQQVQFQFNINKDLYLAKVNSSDQLEWVKVEISTTELNTKNITPIYFANNSILEQITKILTSYKTTLYWIILSLLIMTIAWLKFFKKKSMPKEVVAILYHNFFSALTIIEKELLEALYQSNLKGEELSTKTINKIIGVQQKDTLTQNKSRSDHFIKMNQKFKMATQHTDPLIIKNRDKADKRQFNYDLNALYLAEVEKLFK